jgi:hypothetical protein
MKYKTCPKCNSDWILNKSDWILNKDCIGKWTHLELSTNMAFDFKCSNIICDMKSNAKGTEVYIKRFMNGINLVWSIETNQCSFMSMNEALDRDIKGESLYNLPWLPFDITPERLKLYLAFV